MFDYFKNLRDKHLVHDENAYVQSMPAAVLNKGDKAYKIEKILCLSSQTQTLHQDSYANFHLLVKTALGWVASEFDTLATTLTNELEACSYDELFAKKALSYRPPTVFEVAKKRAMSQEALPK